MVNFLTMPYLDTGNQGDYDNILIDGQPYNPGGEALPNILAPRTLYFANFDQGEHLSHGIIPSDYHEEVNNVGNGNSSVPSATPTSTSRSLFEICFLQARCHRVNCFGYFCFDTTNPPTSLQDLNQGLDLDVVVVLSNAHSVGADPNNPNNGHSVLGNDGYAFGEMQPLTAGVTEDGIDGAYHLRLHLPIPGTYATGDGVKNSNGNPYNISPIPKLGTSKEVIDNTRPQDVRDIDEIDIDEIDDNDPSSPYLWPSSIGMCPFLIVDAWNVSQKKLDITQGVRFFNDDNPTQQKVVTGLSSINPDGKQHILTTNNRKGVYENNNEWYNCYIHGLEDQWYPRSTKPSSWEYVTDMQDFNDFMFYMIDEAAVELK